MLPGLFRVLLPFHLLEKAFSPNPANGLMLEVNVKNGVFADEVHFLLTRLGNKDRVEWVPVVEREFVLPGGVGKGNRKDVQAILGHVIHY